MSDIHDLFDQVAAQTAQIPEDAHVQRVLLQRALECTRAPEAARRRQGLAVARALGDSDAMEVVAAFLSDPEPSIRAAAWEIGRAAGDVGINVIRDAAGCGDEAIAVQAIALLDARTDKQSASTMRRLLHSPHAPVRLGAVRLLGRIAGLSVLREVERLQQDPDAEVRKAATAARGLILGEPVEPEVAPRAAPPAPPLHPPASPTPADASASPQPLPHPLAPPAPPPQPPLPPEGPATEGGLAALREASRINTLDRPGPTEAPAPEPALPAVILPSAPGSVHAPPDPIPLPSPLPSEALALLRLLGRVEVGDRPAVLDRLRRADTNAIGEALSGYRPGADAARGRGLGIAATVMGNARWVMPLRGLLKDPDETARACATVALGSLAGPSLLPALGALAADPSPAVRAACAWALGEAARRLDAAGAVSHWLNALAGDKDAEVVAAVAAARALPGAPSA